MKIMILLCLFAIMGCSTGEDEIYILPKNYVGVVYIIFNQETGMKPIYEDGKRVYEIPPNGILKTQFKINEGWHGIPKYYYIDKGQQVAIPYQIDAKELKVDTLQVCCIQNGNSYTTFNEAIPYQRFFIGTKQQIDSIYEVEQRRDISQMLQNE